MRSRSRTGSWPRMTPRSVIMKIMVCFSGHVTQPSASQEFPVGSNTVPVWYGRETQTIVNANIEASNR